MGQRRRQKGRAIDGVVLLDKPVGDTSNRALQKVKRLYQARKAGHTGSLDPLASGMLPICLGQATKVSAFLLDADKRYRVRAQLGVRTDTADADGEVIEQRPVPALHEADLRRVLDGFLGASQQLPPMYSAVKHEGRRLYELARQGVEVERKPRDIHLHELTLLALADETIELEVHCSKGTYVRTLVEDVAAALGTCAHVIALRRLQVGPYLGDGPLLTLEALEGLMAEGGLEALDEQLLPVDSAISHWPSVRLAADSAFYLRNGQAVQVPRAPTRGLVRLYGEDARFLGMGRITEDGRVAPKRLF
ncbi:MAG: tRNA pseudouridine(55) synthase TruB [Pseudomonadota bacterium]